MSAARRVTIFVAVVTLALGAVATLGVVHPRAASPELQSYLPSITPATVVGAGLLDGINPCAFTVLLLLIAALLASTQAGGAGTLSGMRRRVMLLGSIYVGAVFLTYLALGVGVLSVGRIFVGSHVPSRLGAVAAVFLGLWMLKDVFLPGVGPRLEAPHKLTSRANAIARRGTIPALVVGGILIGLCTVPCSGAIYLAVLSLLASDQQPVRAYLYLVAYNLLFVTPLIAILAVASSRKNLSRLARWQERYRERVRFAIAASVIVLGLGLLAII